MAFQAKAGNRGFQPKSKPPVSRVVLIFPTKKENSLINLKRRNKKSGGFSYV
ncbi:hypothetical protein IGI67_001309 [Enterococcus sp. AZ196]